MRKPKFMPEHCPPPTGSTVYIFLAVRIAQKYSGRLPTVLELMNDWDMCRATAYRWIAAMRAARGLSAND